MMKTMQKNKRGLLIVVSGPSGVGKGTICKKIAESAEDVFLSVSMTTRKPREGEVDGVNYHFATEEEFKAKIENKGFIEWACFCGNYYGTPRDKVEEQLAAGKHVILEIEVQGAMKVRDHFPEGVYIFVLPPSIQELEERLAGRGTEPSEVINQRLEIAKTEFKHVNRYNYILINDDLDIAVKEFFDIVSAETLRVERNAAFIKEMSQI